MIEVPGFVVRGAPRTKKNSPRIVTIPRKGALRCHTCGHMTGFPRILPSEAYEEWESAALRECLVIRPVLTAAGFTLPITSPIGIEALIYRDRNVGDLSNYLEAVADMLQAAGIIADDRQIEDWDGSRRLIDRDNPRVEIYITILEETPIQESFL